MRTIALSAQSSADDLSVRGRGRRNSRREIRFVSSRTDRPASLCCDASQRATTWRNSSNKCAPLLVTTVKGTLRSLRGQARRANRRGWGSTPLPGAFQTELTTGPAVPPTATPTASRIISRASRSGAGQRWCAGRMEQRSTVRSGTATNGYRSCVSSVSFSTSPGTPSTNASYPQWSGTDGRRATL